MQPKNAGPHLTFTHLLSTLSVAHAPQCNGKAAVAAGKAEATAGARWDLVDVDANVLHEALVGQLDTHLQVVGRRMIGRSTA